MKIGIISEKYRYVIDRFRYPEYELLNFSISIDELSFFQIFHSAFSTPARYVMELFKRLAMIDINKQRDDCFIFNPLFEVNATDVSYVLAELRGIGDYGSPIVFMDCNSYPVGYFFPSSVSLDSTRYLSLLSTVDGIIDQQFLEKSLLRTVGAVTVRLIDLRHTSHNDFYFNDDFKTIYRWTTRTALDILAKSYNSLCANAQSTETITLKQVRDTIPFAAIMPYHAGDVLFFSLAAQHIRTYFTAIVITKMYSDIIIEQLPHFRTIILVSKPPYREGNNILDEKYFQELITYVPKNYFYYYMRPTRLYNISNFHLIDHFAFGLGSSFMSKKELLIHTKHSPTVYKSLHDGRNFNILLHFEGGWPLKVYPKPYREKLIELLQDEGFSLTVLGDSSADNGQYKSVRFITLDDFKELLTTHHMLVGMDSFPCHYAVHVVGLPTICLFSCTRPVNSNAPASPSYQWLENMLPCNACNGYDICYKSKGNLCQNFVTPEKVFAEILNMLQHVYSYEIKGDKKS